MSKQRGPRSGGLVNVIEAAYDLDEAGGDERWIRNIVEALAPGLDRGLGVGAYVSEAGRPFAAVCGLGLPENWADPLKALLTSSLGAQLIAPQRPAQTGSNGVGRQAWEANEIMRREWHPRGIRDGIGIVCADGTGMSVTFFAPMAKIASLRADTTRRYELLAAHISAGLRLRRDAQRVCSAVVTPEGKVVHAEGRARSSSSRELLRGAALAVERARRPEQPASDDSRIKLWKVLVAGEWSLVDQFESDGQRFLIARENAPQVTEPRALTPRERQVLAYIALGHSPELMAYELGLPVASVMEARESSVRKLGVELLSAREREVVERAARGSHNKAIAYDLGLSHSTVRVLMSRAAAKLGVRTRGELLAKITKTPGRSEAHHDESQMPSV